MKTTTSVLFIATVAALVAQPALAASQLIVEYKGHLVTPIPSADGVNFEEYAYQAPANYMWFHVTGYTGIVPGFKICTINKDGYAFQCWNTNPDMQRFISTGTKTIRVTLTSGADVDYTMRLWKVT